MEWRLIESAPQEGEVIVDLWRDGDRFPEAWWSGERWISYSGGDYKDPGGGNWWVIDDPTHWMPLPDGPYPREPTDEMHAAFHATALDYGHKNLSYSFCRDAWRAMLHAHFYPQTKGPT